MNCRPGTNISNSMNIPTAIKTQNSYDNAVFGALVGAFGVVAISIMFVLTHVRKGMVDGATLRADGSE